MDKVKHLFERSESREIINEISDTVSSVVGANIAIKSSLNVKDVKVTPESTSISNNFLKIHGIIISELYCIVHLCLVDRVKSYS